MLDRYFVQIFMWKIYRTRKDYCRCLYFEFKSPLENNACSIFLNEVKLLREVLHDRNIFRYNWEIESQSLWSVTNFFFCKRTLNFKRNEISHTRIYRVKDSSIEVSKRLDLLFFSFFFFLDEVMKWWKQTTLRSSGPSHKRINSDTRLYSLG